MGSVVKPRQVEKRKAACGQLRVCPCVLRPGARLEPAPEGFCRLQPRAAPAVEVAIWRSLSAAVACLELLAESELDLTSENPICAVQQWILRDCSFEGANTCMCLNM